MDIDQINSRFADLSARKIEKFERVGIGFIATFEGGIELHLSVAMWDRTPQIFAYAVDVLTQSILSECSVRTRVWDEKVVISLLIACLGGEAEREFRAAQKVLKNNEPAELPLAIGYLLFAGREYFELMDVYRSAHKAKEEAEFALQDRANKKIRDYFETFGMRKNEKAEVFVPAT